MTSVSWQSKDGTQARVVCAGDPCEEVRKQLDYGAQLVHVRSPMFNGIVRKRIVDGRG